MKLTLRTKAVMLIVGMLLADQVVKFIIKLNFPLGGYVEIFPWFQICFVENAGMAFGWELGSKVFLTLFRIVAIGALSYYIHILIKKQAKTGFVLTIALVLAGAVGNLIDCLFYGLIFSESSYMQVATLFPDGGGYAPLLYGKVVDMFYFPLIHNAAGDVLFFRPVFNVADSAITVAVFVILIFYRKEFNDSLEKAKK